MMKFNYILISILSQLHCCENVFMLRKNIGDTFNVLINMTVNVFIYLIEDIRIPKEHKIIAK